MSEKWHIETLSSSGKRNFHEWRGKRKPSPAQIRRMIFRDDRVLALIHVLPVCETCLEAKCDCEKP